MTTLPGSNVAPSLNELPAPLAEAGIYVLPSLGMLPGLNSANYGQLTYDSLTYGGTE